MPDKHTKGEMHGCIVCGKLHELYVVYDAAGNFIDCKVMSAGARCVPNATRPLVACNRHTQDQIERAVERAYGKSASLDD